MTTFRVLIVVILQTLALGYMIIDRQQMLNASRFVTLKVIPVDPRDIFRGDYVVLNYEISRIDAKMLEGEDKFDSGDDIFVTLMQQGEEWRATSISKQLSASTKDTVVLKGRVMYTDIPPDPATATSLNINVQYGIESYFVPQGTGRAIEEDARKGVLTVDVAVDGKGRAAIKALRREGKVYYVEGLL